METPAALSADVSYSIFIFRTLSPETPSPWYLVEVPLVKFTTKERRVGEVTKVPASAQWYHSSESLVMLASTIFAPVPPPTPVPATLPSPVNRHRVRILVVDVVLASRRNTVAERADGPFGNTSSEMRQVLKVLTNGLCRKRWVPVEVLSVKVNGAVEVESVPPRTDHTLRS